MEPEPVAPTSMPRRLRFPFVVRILAAMILLLVLSFRELATALFLYSFGLLGYTGVKVLAPSSLPSTMPADASALYARNILHFINELVDAKTGELTLDMSNEVIAATLVCRDGAAVRS